MGMVKATPIVQKLYPGKKIKLSKFKPAKKLKPIDKLETVREIEEESSNSSRYSV